MVQSTTWGMSWPDDGSVISEITVDADLLSECSTVLTFDDDGKRWDRSSQAQKRGSITSESSKDTAPTKPERKGSSHDRNRRRVRSSRHSASSHSTYKTMVTISEEGEESPSSPSGSPTRRRGKKRTTLGKKKRNLVDQTATIHRIMKEFLDDENRIVVSDTDETTETRKTDKKTIKNVVSESLSESIREAAGIGESSESSLNLTGGSTINEPTPQMMKIIERLSVQAALAMTARPKNSVDDSEIDYSSSDASSYKDIKSFHSSWSSISTKSNVTDGSKKKHGATRDVSRVPGLEEDTSESSVSSIAFGDGSRSSNYTTSTLGGFSASSPLTSPSTSGSQKSVSQCDIRDIRPCDSPTRCTAPLTLTPAMKGLIEKLSVKAALSVISQSESSLIQDAVLDHTSSHSNASK